MGYSKYEPSRLINWFEEASKIAHCATLDPATAEQKMSRKAREEFCRSSMPSPLAPSVVSSRPLTLHTSHTGAEVVARAAGCWATHLIRSRVGMDRSRGSGWWRRWGASKPDPNQARYQAAQSIWPFQSRYGWVCIDAYLDKARTQARGKWGRIEEYPFLPHPFLFSSQLARGGADGSSLRGLCNNGCIQGEDARPLAIRGLKWGTGAFCIPAYLNTGRSILSVQ